MNGSGPVVTIQQHGQRIESGQHRLGGASTFHHQQHVPRIQTGAHDFGQFSSNIQPSQPPQSYAAQDGAVKSTMRLQLGNLKRKARELEE